jgi:hypothetical protein
MVGPGRSIDLADPVIEGVPEEVLERALRAFGPQDHISELLRDQDRRPFDTALLFWYPKADICRGSAWDKAASHSERLRVKKEHKYWGWRKCHTEHYWCWYAYDLATEGPVQEASDEADVDG